MEHMSWQRPSKEEIDTKVAEYARIRPALEMAEKLQTDRKHQAMQKAYRNANGYKFTFDGDRVSVGGNAHDFAPNYDGGEVTDHHALALIMLAQMHMETVRNTPKLIHY